MSQRHTTPKISENHYARSEDYYTCFGDHYTRLGELIICHIQVEVKVNL